MIDALRNIAGFGGESAPDVAKELAVEVRKQVARGENPRGQKWALTREGKQPLVNAAKAVSVRALGTRVVMRITGHHARHHFGAVWGKVKRELIPNERIPDPMVRAIERVLAKRFDKIMGGS